ncbi:MAG: transcription termination factor NusA [Candidatus Hydrogenedentales bacterium]
MSDNLKLILQQLESEKSMDRHTLLEAIRSAIETAARKALNRVAYVSVDIDPKTLAINVYEIRLVTETIQDPTSEILLEDALKLNPEVVVGNRLKVPATPAEFGRIAAQTARQVIAQKIKEAERERIFEEFKQREGDVVTGAVKRMVSSGLLVSIGQVEALLPMREQSPREKYKIGDRIRAIVIEVNRAPHNTKVILSRTSPELVRVLFEMEVPEIYDGTVMIKSIARDAGSRTKVAVVSLDPHVDAVGACVGLKGTRVRAVVDELYGEKIDIIRWSENPQELCVHALNPVDIVKIELNEEMKRIHVQVPQDQLSLAIGKRGQNARLASQLVGWNIDIRGSDEEHSEEDEDLSDEGDEDTAVEESVPEQSDTAQASEEVEPVEDTGEHLSQDAEEQPAD